MQIDLRGLGLAQKWPRLTALQGEVADLEQRLHKARGAAHAAQNELPHARERDIELEARALRSGKKLPAPEHGPRVEARRQDAERQAERLARALQAAREEYGEHLAAAQAELYRDVLGARDAVAREAAEAAEVTRRAYSRYEALARTVRDLTPAPPTDEYAPSQRITNSFYGLHTRQLGPARGDIEQALGYLISLPPSEAESQEAGGDAAA
jgi:hypothetical protein